MIAAAQGQPDGTAGERYSSGGKPVTRTTGGTSQERAAVEQLQAKIFGTRRGSEILQGLSNRQSPLDIQLNHSGDLFYSPPSDYVSFPPNDFVAFDPTAQPRIWVEMPPPLAAGPTQIIASPARILGHELGHAIGFGDVNYLGLPRMENVIINENPIAIELGEPPRVRY